MDLRGAPPRYVSALERIRDQGGHVEGDLQGETDWRVDHCRWSVVPGCGSEGGQPHETHVHGTAGTALGLLETALPRGRHISGCLC